MSTQLEPIKSDTQKDSLSLAELVAALGSTSAPPSLEQFFSWLRESDISPEDLQPYISFKEGNYWRHRVFRNEFVEMLVLCWRPGQRTPIHDHNGSHGGVKIWEGHLWETIFSYDEANGLEYKSGRELAQGSVTGSDVPDIHQLGNPDVSEKDLVTLHIYSPPLGVLHTYKPVSAKVDLYTHDDVDALVTN